jgi:hypothetical protein
MCAAVGRENLKPGLLNQHELQYFVGRSFVFSSYALDLLPFVHYVSALVLGEANSI